MTLARARVAVYAHLPRRAQRFLVGLMTPSYSVGAMGLVTDDGHRLLLVRTHYREGWLAPGGFLSRGELAVAGLVRELREELGVEAAVAEPHRVNLDPGRRSVTFVSVARLPLGTSLTLDGVELAEARWFALDALPPFGEDFTEGVTEADLAAVRASGEGLHPGKTAP